MAALQESCCNPSEVEIHKATKKKNLLQNVRILEKLSFDLSPVLPKGAMALENCPQLPSVLGGSPLVKSGLVHFRLDSSSPAVPGATLSPVSLWDSTEVHSWQVYSPPLSLSDV